MGGIAAEIFAGFEDIHQSRRVIKFFDMTQEGSALELGVLVRHTATTLRFSNLAPSEFFSSVGLITICQFGPDPVVDLSLVIANVRHTFRKTLI